MPTKDLNESGTFHFFCFVIYFPSQGFVFFEEDNKIKKGFKLNIKKQKLNKMQNRIIFSFKINPKK
jgi:hypothetical protein